MTSPLRVERVNGGVEVWTLDRPPANALDDSMLESLDQVADAAATDPTVRAVVITGAGRFFCAGFDLGAPRRDDVDADRTVELYRSAHRRLLALPKPTVAWVNGHAVAGGLVLALGCDVRLAALGDSKFGVNEVAIGSSFPSTAIEIVKCRLAPNVATRLTLGAELHPFSDAPAMGVFDELTPAEQGLEQAIEIATRLGAYPAEVFAHTKRALTGEALDRIDAVSIDDELAAADLWRSDESRAARASQRARLGR
jgi:enoyl-CoA hydratase